MTLEGIDCRTSEQHMNSFIDNKLVGDELCHFLNHVLNCSACYEELETRFLLSQALQRLENGETINLQKELKQKVRGARIALKIHRFFDAVSRTLEIIAAISVVFVLMNELKNFI